MMKNIFYGCICLFSSMILMTSAWGSDVQTYIDIYKSKQISEKTIGKVLTKKINKLASLMLFTNKNKLIDKEQLASQLMSEIKTELKKKGSFAYIGISPILYPDRRQIYMSIDIVDESEKERLSYFLPKQTRHMNDPGGIIKVWLRYQQTGERIMVKEKEFPKFKTCSAFHCLYGFEKKGLKKYEIIFNSLVPGYQKELVAILREDSDEQKRAAAAYLLAHIKNGRELVNILLPSLYDASSLVRNNVMRVIVLTLTKVTITDFPIERVIKVLEFPATTDRNKALSIIYVLTRQPVYAKYIASHALGYIMDCLHLHQPNIHDTSYLILKQISGQHYSDHDYAAWRAWARNYQ